jgi:hypothetical protein
MSDILSNSSMQTTPLSASTIAPASSLLSPVSWSVVTAAVRPTPEEPRPVVAMALGAVHNTYLHKTPLWYPRDGCCRLLPQKLRFGDAGVAYQQDVDVPSQSGAVGQHLLHPSSNRHSMARLMYSCPWIEGASDLASKLKMFLWERASCLHRATSSREMQGLASLLSWDRLLAITTVLQCFCWI